MSLRDRRIIARLVAVLAVLALVAVACGDDDDGESTATTAGATGGVPKGGTLTFGLEEEPECLDWLGSCATVTYGFWAANVTTIPRAFSVEKAGESYAYVPTSLLDGEPKLDLSGAKPTVTYRINPDAVWSDGEPITSSDFKYVWEQVTTPDADIQDTTGYEKIENVDDSDPATAVVTFSEPFADWRSLFGSIYGVLPSHLLKGKDRAAEMANGYDWSGGPWKIESWKKGETLTLVPNDAYWGNEARLDKVVFTFVTDSASEFRAFDDNEVDGIYPQPSIEIVDQIASGGLDDANAEYTAETGNTEGLWINTERPPLDDVKVRQAMAYSIDRDAIVNRIFGKIGVKRALQDVTPPILDAYGAPDAFAKYKKDLDQVDELMTDAGWAKKDGVWTKDGKKATLELFSFAGIKTRELISQVLQSQLQEAGFDVPSPKFLAPPDLFQPIVFPGKFNLLLLTRRIGSFYPESCTLFCSKNIPVDGPGNNINRVNDPKLDELYSAGETEMETAKAQRLNRQGNEIVAEKVYFLPLDPQPDILLTSKRVVGTVKDNPVMGPFWTLWGWGLKK